MLVSIAIICWSLFNYYKYDLLSISSFWLVYYLLLVGSVVYNIMFFSTREIKPNQGDIGRKVKVKQNRSSFLPVARRDTPSPRESLSKPSYLPNVPSKPVIHSNNGLSNGLGLNHISNARSPHNKPSMPDIAKRPIRYFIIIFWFWSTVSNFEI